jgi:hypothetical protein
MMKMVRVVGNECGGQDTSKLFIVYEYSFLFIKTLIIATSFIENCS